MVAWIACNGDTADRKGLIRMGQKRRVVVIGAAGYICRQLLPDFRRRYDLVLLDTRDTNSDGDTVEGIRIANLLDENLEVNRGHFAGADAIVHCGFTSPGPDSTERARFDAEMRNVRMCQYVFELARLEHVPRVVVA